MVCAHGRIDELDRVAAAVKLFSGGSQKAGLVCAFLAAYLLVLRHKRCGLRIGIDRILHPSINGLLLAFGQEPIDDAHERGEQL